MSLKKGGSGCFDGDLIIVISMCCSGGSFRKVIMYHWNIKVEGPNRAGFRKGLKIIVILKVTT